MSQTKPKWLLTALIVVAILGLSVAGYAAPPPDPTIIGPTTAEPVAVKQGNNVYVTFDYISQPTEAGTTRAEIVIRKGATIIGTRQVAFPLLPDTGEHGADFTAAVAINTPVAEGTYNIRLQIGNHDGLSTNILESDAVLVDNTAPDDVADFGTIISGKLGPTLTWLEPADTGTPASGIGWYEVSIYDGVKTEFFDDVSAVGADPITHAFSWTVPQELSDGNYTVTVWARDKAYNKSGDTDPGKGTLIIDTTNPVLDQQGPVGYVNNASPTLTARFRDLGLGVSGYKQLAAPDDVFTLDDTDLLSPTSQPGAGDATGIITRSIVVPLAPLAQGEHEVALTLHDLAGNEASLTWEFFVDTVPPFKPGAITLTDPVTSDTPRFSWVPGEDNDVLGPPSGVAGYAVAIHTTGMGGALVRGPYMVTDDEDPDNTLFDWQLPVLDALTLDGDYEIRVWTVDNAGNSSADWASGTFRRDTEVPLLDMEEPANTTWTDFVPPTIKVRFRDLGAGATGFASVDAFTVDSNPYTATGLATRALGPDFIVADLTGASLGDGEHTVSITVSDVAGNSASKTWVFNIDTTPPQPPTGIEVVGGTLALPPPPPVWWSNVDHPQFQWPVAMDSGSGIASYTVEIYLDVDQHPELTYDDVVDETPGGDVQWTIPVVLADGIYTIRVYAVDVCGNKSELFAETSVGLDTSIAVKMLDQQSPDPYVNVKTPTLSVRFRDLAVPSSGYHSTLEFKVDKGSGTEVDLLPLLTLQPLGGALVGHVKAVSTDLAEGSHTAYIEVRDYANNHADLTWNVFVDTTRPNAPGVITVVTPMTDTTPNFTWAAASDPGVPDTGSDIAGYEAEIHNGTGLVRGRYYGISGLSWELPDPLSADGEYTIKLWAVDNAGNVSDTSNDATFRIDTTPPVLDNPSPIGAIKDDTPELYVRFSDTGGSGYGSTTLWTISNGGSITLAPSTEPPPGDYIKATPSGALADGEYSVLIKVKDLAGNETIFPMAPSTWSFTVDTVVPNAPDYAYAPEWTNDTTPEFTWNEATDEGDGSGIAGYILEVWTTGLGAAKIRGPYKNITGTSYTLPLSGALSPDGEYEVRVWSVDNAGNVSGDYDVPLESNYASDKFKLDTGKPVLSNGTPTDPDFQPRTETLRMQFADDWSGLAGVHTSITIADGRGRPGTVGAPTQPLDGKTTGQISAVYGELDELTDGTWTVTAKVRDRAGNVSDEYTWSFRVDGTDPVITAVYPGDETTTWDKWTEIRATIVDDPAPDGTSGSGVNADTIYGVLEGPAVWDLGLLLKDFQASTGLAVFQVPFGLDLADGLYQATVGARDMAGNPGGTEWTFLLQQTYAPGMKALPEFISADSVTVKWSDVDNEEWYELQVDTAPGFGAAASHFLSSDEVSREMTDLLDGTYYFRVRAIAYDWTDPAEAPRKGRVSLWSNTVSTTVDMIGPAAPTLKLESKSPTNQPTQQWSWSRPVDAVDYDVYWNTTGTAPVASSDPSEPSVGNIDQYYTEFKHTNLDVEYVEYHVWVRGIDALGNKGSWSNMASVRIDMKRPAAPQNLRLYSMLGTVKQIEEDGPWFTNDNRPAMVYDLGEEGPIQEEEGLTYRVVVDYHAYPPTERYMHFFECLGDGPHLVYVTAIDAVGNESDPSWLMLFVDTAPPEAPGMPVPDETPTKNTTPAWTWDEVYDEEDEDSDFAYYNVYADGVKVVFEEGKEPTTGSYTSAPLTHGLHVLEVTSVDDLGNESAKSTAGHVFIDLEKPTKPIMNPMPEYSKKGPITFSWSASSDDLAVEYKFEYTLDYDADPLVWTEKTPQGQSCVVDATDVGDGKIIAGRVWAVDKVGNTSLVDDDPENASTEGTAIDAAAPTPVAGKFSPTDEVTTGEARPTWTWEFTDAGSGLDYYIVTFDEEASFRTTDTSFRPASKLDSGVYVLKVEAVDKVGNKAEHIFPDVTVDVTPPEVPGMPTTTSPTKEKKPVWKWAHIANAAGDLKQYNVYLDGSLKGSVTDSPWPDDITWGTPDELTHGLHVLEVTSVDKLGNESAKSTAGHVFIDLEKPTKPIMNPMPEYSKEGPITFSWSASSDDLAVDYRFQYKIGTADWSTVETLVGQSRTVDASGAGDGTIVQGRVWAVDKVGNTSLPDDEDVSKASTEKTTIDAAAPTPVEGKFSPTGMVRTGEARPTWTWEFTDAGSGLDYYIVTFDEEASFRTTATSFRPASKLDSGVYVLTVEAVDKVGNKAEHTFPDVTVDVTPPEVPGMPTTTSPTKNKQPVWKWAHIANAAGDLKQYNVYLDGSLKGSVTDSPWPDDITWGTPDELTHGRHVLEVTSVDDLGNESAKSTAGHVFIDLEKPTKPIMNPMPEYSKEGPITFSWSASSDDLAVEYKFQYKIGTADWSTVETLVGQSRTVDAADDGTIVQGRVWAVDKVGNTSLPDDEDVSKASTEKTTIDAVGPVVSITNPTEEVTTNAVEFTYTWTAVDGGCGVDYCTVRFNGGEHRVETPASIASDIESGILTYAYAWTATLKERENTFEVWATDMLGNKSKVVAVAPVVTQVKPQIVLVQPMPGVKYKINEISTIAFQVIGLVVDEESEYIRPEVLVNGEPLEAWRIVPVVEPPGMAKFYILLDSDVMVPGTMGVRIKVGAGSELAIYTVDSERSGFGFGRLRPW